MVRKVVSGTISEGSVDIGENENGLQRFIKNYKSEGAYVTDGIEVSVQKMLPKNVSYSPEFKFDWKFKETERYDPAELINSLTVSTFKLSSYQVLDNLFARTPDVQNDTVVINWRK